jgi:NADH-quinone oxidoreductase subunit H
VTLPGPLASWYDFRDLSNAVERLLSWLEDIGPHWLVYVVSAVIGCTAIFLFVAATAIANIWVERRVVARIQVRRGPNRAGPWGLLQPIADMTKLMQKEALIPRASDPVVFMLAPILVFAPALLVWGVFPFGKGMTLVDLDVGVLYIIAITSVTTIVLFMAGWSSNNKYSLLGAMRVIAMLLSYEIPLVLALLGVVLFAGTMSLNGIVAWQQDMRVWLFLLQPLAFVVYFICATAEINRTPTDIAEAESEIVAGYHTEYSGITFGLFYAVELVNAMAVGAIAATLFFGGWWLFGLDRWIPGWLIFVGKIYFFYGLLIWLRGTLPRLRIDQLMAFAWKFLLPLALVNLMLGALEVLLWVEYDLSAGLVLPIFSIVNLGLAAVLIAGWMRLMAFPFHRLPSRARLVHDIPVVAPGAPAGGGA